MISRGFWLVVLLGLCFGQPAAAQTGESAIRKALGDCGQICVVQDNPGGSVRLFQEAAQAVLGGARTMVVIDGPCASACVIFADIARSRVCITSRASFRFHKASLIAISIEANGDRRVELLERSDPPHSRDIARWVANNGGFPTSGMRVMSSKQARSFWRPCTGAAIKTVASANRPQPTQLEQALQRRTN